MRCPLCGHSTRVFEIASRRSKDNCGNISMFSLGTKMSDIQVDSRVPSPPDLRFRSSRLSVVARGYPAMCKQPEPGLVCADEHAPITHGLKAALDNITA